MDELPLITKLHTEIIMFLYRGDSKMNIRSFFIHLRIWLQ